MAKRSPKQLPDTLLENVVFASRGSVFALFLSFSVVFWIPGPQWEPYGQKGANRCPKLKNITSFLSHFFEIVECFPTSVFNVFLVALWEGLFANFDAKGLHFDAHFSTSGCLFGGCGWKMGSLRNMHRHERIACLALLLEPRQAPFFKLVHICFLKGSPKRHFSGFCRFWAPFGIPLETHLETFRSFLWP